MIRPATPADTAGIVGVAVGSGLFPPEEVGLVEELVTGPAGDAVCLVDDGGHDDGGDGDGGDQSDGGGVRAVAWAEPVRGTDGTWELTMIAVDRAAQGTGRGSALLREVERRVHERGARLLLVLTSGTPELAGARAFYAARGYGEEARVRDYYAPGDDMVLFRLALAA